MSKCWETRNAKTYLHGARIAPSRHTIATANSSHHQLWTYNEQQYCYCEQIIVALIFCTWTMDKYTLRTHFYFNMALAVWGRARYLSVTEAPHNTNFHTWMGKKQFCFFQTAETGNRTPDSGVKGSGANHYPRAPAPVRINSVLLGFSFSFEYVIQVKTSVKRIGPRTEPWGTLK